jgi:hypothetical protein
MNPVIITDIIWHWSSCSYYKKRWREYLFKKQEGLCFYCKKPMSLTARRKTGQPARNFATFEHLQRIADGGKTNSHNVVLAHSICNQIENTRAQRRDNTFYLYQTPKGATWWQAAWPVSWIPREWEQVMDPRDDSKPFKINAWWKRK